MKKILKIIFSVVLIIGLFYLSGFAFYSNKFAINTEFGSVNISHLSMEEAEEKVQQELNERPIRIEENGDFVATIRLKETQAKYNLTDALAKSFENRTPSFWFTNIVQANDYEDVLTGENINIDSESLETILEERGISNDSRVEAVDAALNFNEQEGFFIQEGKEGQQVDMDSVSEAIVHTLDEGSNTIELSEHYQGPKVTETNADLITEFNQIKQASDFEYILEVAGNDIQITPEMIQNWMYLDENNSIAFDRELITQFVIELNDTYSTYYKDRQFESTLQGTVTVPPGILGWAIDIETEVEQILADLYAGVDVRRQPSVYSSGGIANAADDIGSTYVEIDLTNQMMYLYYEGTLIISTPIVSGQTGTETVPGANAVNEMLRDTELVGYSPRTEDDYSVPVDYWIRFDNQAQGIHDASWQYAFGGDVWTYAGSLGCINTPLDVMGVIYEYVNYGTPVLVFY